MVPNSNPENTPEGMAKLFNVPYLGSLPMDPNLMKSCENGVSYTEQFPDSQAALAMMRVADRIIANAK